MKILAALVGSLGLVFLGYSEGWADEQYDTFQKAVYSRWNPPPNAQVVKGELSINAAGQLVDYNFSGVENQTQQSLLAAISQVSLATYAPDAASSLNGIVRLGVEFDPKKALAAANSANPNLGSASGPKSKNRRAGDAAQNGAAAPTFSGLVPPEKAAGALPSSPASEETPAGSPKEVLEATWNTKAFMNIPFGQMAVLGGPAAGNQEPPCGSGSVSQGGLNGVKAAQTIGLVWAVEDVPSQQYNQGQSFSWGQMLDQTTAGVQARITVTLTPLGKSLDVTNSLAPALRLKNCLRIRQGVFRVTQVVKEEPQRKGVTDYKVLFVNYKGTWNPHFKQLMQILGQPLSDNRKAIALVKHDPFSSKWIYVTGDLADADKDFTTANVANALAVAK